MSKRFTHGGRVDNKPDTFTTATWGDTKQAINPNPGGYALRNGCIVSPGKFEGEPLYAPYFWENADTDFYDGETPVTAIIITPEDRELFPDLLTSDVYAVLLWESEQGFVHTRELASQAELDSIIADCESDDDGGDDE